LNEEEVVGLAAVVEICWRRVGREDRWGSVGLEGGRKEEGSGTW